MAAMLMLPVWSAWGPRAVLPVLTPAPAVPVTRLALDMNGQIVSTVPVRPAFWTVETVLIAVWLIGAGVLLSRLLTGTIRTNRLRRRDGEGLVTPITVGWLRPSVILPAGWREWPPEQLRAVMAHEEEHARRRDPLVQWLALFNRAVFWFHPLAWWLEKRLAGLSEEACDDAVLMGGHDPLEYSEFLLGLARAVREAGARVEVVGMAMPGTFLPERIRRIAGGVKVQRISGTRMAGLVVFCGAASLVCAAVSVGYRPHAAAPMIPAAAPVSGAKRAASVVREGRSVRGHRKGRAPVLLTQAAPDGRYTRTDGAHLGVPGGSLYGSVLDPANLPVPDAPITLTNTDSGATLTTATNDLGDYRIAGVPAGTYAVSVRVPGFKTLTQTGIRMGLGENRNDGKMLLEVGEVSQTVNISGSRNAPVPYVGTLGPMTTVPNSAPPAPAPSLISGPLPSTGGKVGAANLLKQIRPSYPVELQRAGVTGTVRLGAVISKEGMLTGTRLISSPDPGLTQAAMNAVSQWRYRPSSLDGQPIEVLTTIDVNYSLRD
jgi:TonB family protein